MTDIRTKSEPNKIARLRHNRKCTVCGEPAHLFSANSIPVCLRAECKHVLVRKQHMHHYASEQYFALQSRQVKWNIRQSTLKKQMLAEQRKKQEKAYVARLMTKINDVHGYDPTIYPYAMIPKNTRKLGKLPERRKNYFRKFLSTLIKETFSEFEDNNVNDTENVFQYKAIEDMYPMESRACAVCRGVCCTTGGKNAYIKKETILRYMHRHPDQKPEQVLAAYMDHLGKKTFIDSCVYHTVIGCSLPRNMRADTCNEFLCDTLIELDRLLNKTPVPIGVYLIEYAKENWREDNLDDDDIVALLTPEPAL